jgi:GTP-binding protein
MPNAGKSSLISRVSSARPKVADYPFTTLYPNLGVVRVDSERSFVIADIPGVIEGAADGAGLGLKFLKHLARTKLLLHLVDIAPMDEQVDPVKDVRKISAELEKYGDDLLGRERWLVLTKRDLISADDLEIRRRRLIEALGWDGPLYAISSVSGQGLDDLVAALMTRLESLRAEEAVEPVDEDQPYDPVNS